MKLFQPNEKVVANSRPLWTEFFGRMGEKYKNTIALVADLSRSTCTENFRKNIPERFFNMGIAEQNMVGVAAGLALDGFVPYCATFAPFATMRACEQFRTDVCYMNLDVRLIGTYGGIVQPAGPTHSGIEDAGIIRGMANSTVVCPSDIGMIEKVFEASATYKGPMYIRLGTGANEAYIYDEDYKYEIGKAIIVRPGKDATIISFGMILRTALEAALELEKEGINVGIVDMHTLKPLDQEAVLAVARQTGRIVTLEEHQLTNGLGSAVAETLIDAGVPCKVKRLGIPNLYPSYGDPEKLRVKYGFGTAATVAAVKLLL
jgi:transketolase